jgi:glycosyltransferase involved in cell wall biosynthesis
VESAALARPIEPLPRNRQLPGVTVLMPVYNGARYVAQAIESVLAQTHPRFELLIVDDGSTDRTPEILARYAARDPRVRVVRQPNLDQPRALNRGLALARYDWVAIHDHDDVSLPRRLERQLLALAREPQARVIGTFAVEINSRGEALRRRAQGPTTAAEFRAWRAAGRRVPLVHPSVLLHRPSVLALGGYEPPFASSADSELWTRVAERHPIVVVPEPLLLYRIHGQSMSFRRMFEQRERLRWITARDRARAEGRPLPTLEAFRAQRPVFGRLYWRERRQDLFWFCRSYCWLALGEGRRLPAAALGACAAALAPGNALRAAGRALAVRRARALRESSG